MDDLIRRSKMARETVQNAQLDDFISPIHIKSKIREGSNNPSTLSSATSSCSTTKTTTQSTASTFLQIPPPCLSPSTPIISWLGKKDDATVEKHRHVGNLTPSTVSLGDSYSTLGCTDDLVVSLLTTPSYVSSSNCSVGTTLQQIKASFIPPPPLVSPLPQVLDDSDEYQEVEDEEIESKKTPDVFTNFSNSRMTTERHRSEEFLGVKPNIADTFLHDTLHTTTTLPSIATVGADGQSMRNEFCQATIVTASNVSSGTMIRGETKDVAATCSTSATVVEDNFCSSKEQSQLRPRCCSLLDSVMSPDIFTRKRNDSKTKAESSAFPPPSLHPFPPPLIEVPTEEDNSCTVKTNVSLSATMNSMASVGNRFKPSTKKVTEAKPAPPPPPTTRLADFMAHNQPECVGSCTVISCSSSIISLMDQCSLDDEEEGDTIITTITAENNIQGCRASQKPILVIENDELSIFDETVVTAEDEDNNKEDKTIKSCDGTNSIVFSASFAGDNDVSKRSIVRCNSSSSSECASLDNSQLIISIDCPVWGKSTSEKQEGQTSKYMKEQQHLTTKDDESLLSLPMMMEPQIATPIISNVKYLRKVVVDGEAEKIFTQEKHPCFETPNVKTKKEYKNSEVMRNNKHYRNNNQDSDGVLENEGRRKIKTKKTKKNAKLHDGKKKKKTKKKKPVRQTNPRIYDSPPIPPNRFFPADAFDFSQASIPEDESFSSRGEDSGLFFRTGVLNNMPFPKSLTPKDTPPTPVRRKRRSITYRCQSPVSQNTTAAIELVANRWSTSVGKSDAKQASIITPRRRNSLGGDA